VRRGRPVISTNTESRSEGYFRLEWKLAVDRSCLMADDQAFLLPVAIDDTADASARVPAALLRVQWTRLPGALPTPQFAAQVKRLLDAPRKLSAGKSPDSSARGANATPASRGPDPTCRSRGSTATRAGRRSWRKSALPTNS